MTLIFLNRAGMKLIAEPFAVAIYDRVTEKLQENWSPE